MQIEPSKGVFCKIMYERFNLDNNIVQNNLQLLYVTCYRYEKQWHGTRHAHDFVEIFFCVGGNCEFHVRDKMFIVQPQQVVIINPDVEHVEKAIPSVPVEWVVLGVKGVRSNLLNDADGYYHGDFSLDGNAVVNLLVDLVTELQNKQKGYNEACLRIVQLLLIHISRVSNISIEQERTQTDRLHSSIAWVKQYIDDNYTHPLNLELLSEKIGLNRFGLIREFKKRYSITPIEYMLSCRFREAKFLLETTNQSIASISRDLGFSSSNYFSQYFQKRFGMTASAYREICRNKNSTMIE